MKYVWTRRLSGRGSAYPINSENWIFFTSLDPARKLRWGSINKITSFGVKNDALPDYLIWFKKSTIPLLQQTKINIYIIWRKKWGWNCNQFLQCKYVTLSAMCTAMYIFSWSNQMQFFSCGYVLILKSNILGDLSFTKLVFLKFLLSLFGLPRLIPLTPFVSTQAKYTWRVERSMIFLRDQTRL